MLGAMVGLIRTGLRSHRLATIGLASVVAMCLGSAGTARAFEGAYAGVDLGASRAANANYRAHVEWGATGNPYVGYMFNDYFGLQGQTHITVQTPDTEPRRYFEHENQLTTLLGITLGPRITLPIGENWELYGTIQGGGFVGVSGRLNHAAPGFSTGGGLDYYLTPQWALSFWGRWNRVYMAPRPFHLDGLKEDQQGPQDARWATGGIGVKYVFAQEKEAPPPAPPPPVVEAPPPPPEKKKIVLRGVNFDTDKSAIRKDAAAILDAAVETLKEESSVAVLIVGHTDSRASEAYNLKLSERRAEAVSKYLSDHGIAADRLKTKGMGETQPVASNDTAEGRAQNRRVELLVE